MRFIWNASDRNRLLKNTVSYSLLTAIIGGCTQEIPVETAAPIPPIPVYEVDASWPKVPFPNNWLIQAVPVVTTDHNDHIWAISRARDLTPDESMATTNPPRGDCCFAAPEILEFDMEGNLINAWGGPGHHPLWPAGPQTIVVDSETNVWVSARGRGDGLMKFSREGEFLWDFGHRGPRPEPGQELPRLVEDNTETDLLPNGVFVFNLDEIEREIYILDYKRVLVYDMDTAEFKRGWGGRGMPLDEITNDPTPPYDWRAGPPPDLDQFAPTLHCVHISVDGLVYVCERGNNRIQIFTKQGDPVFEFHVANHTPARGPECGRIGDPVHARCGTTWNMTFSHDEQQQYVLVADGTNHRIWIHDRFTGEQVGEVGSPGRNAGQFYWLDGIALDSYGNMYTGEVWKGKRAQKFTLVNADGISRVR
jgi:hypothetical protein